jgi:hypothetical protein
MVRCRASTAYLFRWRRRRRNHLLRPVFPPSLLRQATASRGARKSTRDRHERTVLALLDAVPRLARLVVREAHAHALRYVTTTMEERERKAYIKRIDYYEVALLLGACFLVNYVTADAKTNWVEVCCRPLCALLPGSRLSYYRA